MRFFREEKGQALVLAALMLSVLVGFAALTVDVGLVMADRRHGQNAADAAALAGVQILLEGGSAGEAQSSALDYANRNGFGTTQANVPPTQGGSAGNENCVEAIVSRTRPAFFARVFGDDTWDVGARAVACLDPEPKSYGIVVLNETACEALDLDSNVNITINNGGIVVNSDCPTNAFDASSNILVNTAVNDIAGGWVTGTNSQISPPFSRINHIEDPLANLPVPTFPTGPVQVCPNLSGQGSYSFQPGVYNCTIQANSNWILTFDPGDYLITGGLDFGSNINATFGEGTYILGGVGLTANSNVNLTGGEVMFYIYNGCINFNSNVNVNLSAPQAGIYEGILFFLDRTLSCTIEFNSNLVLSTWGTVYAPSAAIDFNSNGQTSYQFIVDTFEIDSNVIITINFQDGVPVDVPSTRLAE